MVMYARKLPRIDDGNPDKREAHSFQSSQYPSKTGYSNHNDRYERHPSPGRDSPSSRNSPRYINKSSYIERNKEKYDRGTSSPGKRANHNYTGSENHSNSGNHSNNSNQASRSNPKDKSEVQKSAIRTCRDWSEHISSSGKKYYYNIKTELSQWEKPREWNDGLASRNDRHSTESRITNDKHGSNSKDPKARHPSGTLEKREKHLGDVRHMVVDSNPKPDKMYLFEKLQQSQTKLQAEMRANLSNKPLYSTDSRDLQRRTDVLSPIDYPNSTSRRCRRDSTGRQTSKLDTEEIDSPDSTPNSHRSVGTSHHTGQGSLPIPSISTSNYNIASIPSLITQLSGGQNNQDLTNKALETLHKLQQALSRQIAAHQSSVSNQHTSTPSSTVQAPSHPHPHQTHHEEALLHAQLFGAQQPAPMPVHHMNVLPKMTPSIVHPGGHPQGHPVRSTGHHYENSHSPGVSHHPNIPGESSPQPILPIVSRTTMESPVSMTTGSTTTSSIPITHTGQIFPQGNTVYGKLGSQNRSSTPNITSHLIEDRGGGLNSEAGGGPHEGANGDDRSSCGSPTPSDTSSQDVPVNPELFNKSQNGQKENNLMSSLQQYYNQRLVGHVTGWQTELIEKQVQAYRDESLKLSSLITSQISVELKRARSLVRVEEIQATLHEQRNLFLAKQIAELESMKPVSSISSFLSSTSAATTPTNSTQSTKT